MAWYQVLFTLSKPQRITWLRYLGSEGKRWRVNEHGYANERCTNTVQQCASELRCLLLVWGQCVRLSFYGHYGLRHTHRFTVKTRIIWFCCSSCDPGYISAHLSPSVHSARPIFLGWSSPNHFYGFSAAALNFISK